MESCPREPEWWAIILSYLLFAGITVGIGVATNDWDTISAMVARDTKTRNAFSFIAGLSLLLQGYWLYRQIVAWSAYVSGPTRSTGVMPAIEVRTPGSGWMRYRFTATLLALGAVSCTVGTIGLVVWSQNVDKSNHLRYAGAMFVGTLVYQLGLFMLWVFVPLPMAMRTTMGSIRLMWFASLGCLIGLWQSDSYWLEYIVVTTLHGGALALTIFRRHIPPRVVMVAPF